MSEFIFYYFCIKVKNINIINNEEFNVGGEIKENLDYMIYLNDQINYNDKNIIDNNISSKSNNDSNSNKFKISSLDDADMLNGDKYSNKCHNSKPVKKKKNINVKNKD